MTFPTDRSSCQTPAPSDIEIVAGREASVSFRHAVVRPACSPVTAFRCGAQQNQVRFLHPSGWSYYATLRRKLHWNSGVS